MEAEENSKNSKKNKCHNLSVSGWGADVKKYNFDQ